ncbi:MAG: MotA/TolQ/ExbB proton channel family protein [Gammaproteobacteria bacterium]
MKKSLPSELLYQVFALLIAFIVIHGMYVAVIRPNAEADLKARAELVQADPNAVTEDSFYVVLRDFEQEACLILMLWALAILAYKGLNTWNQQRLLREDLLGLPEGMPIGLEDMRPLADRLAKLPEQARDFLLPVALTTAIERYAATRNVQDVSTASRDICESEAGRMESELSIIRYIAWAIPSVGFIGTVRGIGDALGQAHKAVEGDITGVTESLGVAFNSTFIALVISIVLMFFIHQLQLMQERLVLDSERYVDKWFIRKLRA